MSSSRTTNNASSIKEPLFIYGAPVRRWLHSFAQNLRTPLWKGIKEETPFVHISNSSSRADMRSTQDVSVEDIQSRVDKARYHIRHIRRAHGNFLVELAEVREGYEMLKRMYIDDRLDDFYHEYRAAQRELDHKEEEREGSEKKLIEAEDLLYQLEDVLASVIRRERRRPCPKRSSSSRSRSTTHHCYRYSDRDSSSSTSGPRREPAADIDRGYYTRETRPSENGQDHFTRETRTDGASSPRSSHSSRGYFTQERRSDGARSSKSWTRPCAHDKRSSGDPKHYRHEQDRGHSSQHHDTRHESGHRSDPRAPSQQPRPVAPLPPQKTIAEWRKYVDNCFADYSKIKRFPHPPIARDGDWEENVKAMLTSIPGFDPKAERLRWHPDRFSSCPAGKVEEFKKLAQKIFVIMNHLKDRK